MMTKNAFFCGMGLGIIVGTYLIKNCPSANRVYDSAEENIKCKVNNIKHKMQQKKENSACCNENQNQTEEEN